MKANPGYSEPEAKRPLGELLTSPGSSLGSASSSPRYTHPKLPEHCYEGRDVLGPGTFRKRKASTE